MKCEKCGKNEATFYYKETVNGKTTEKRMCMDCAHEEGLDRAFCDRTEELFNEFDRPFESFFRDDFFGDFFGGRSLFGSMARTMLAPMLTLPRIEIGMLRPEEKTESAEEKPAEAETQSEENAELSRRREMNALRHQLREAVHAENYEKAIELRDKLRELEK